MFFVHYDALRVFMPIMNAIVALIFSLFVLEHNIRNWMPVHVLTLYIITG